ncbi:FtsX-like permease family protein [Cellulomonas sp. URHD0024]|uniref:FtsX-like permease family protein n=1 Tax=Cellulomonas sp. URHD0024 TaxID=1302620 RepID=UPI000418C6B3|nr:FtsX-like permease family protein [Cellulomonas sp. URHD0024]
MNPVVALAPRFQRAGGRDSRVTTALAITAFTVATGLTLCVVGGLLGFITRAKEPVAPGTSDVRDLYVILAVIALVLLAVPLVTLGGSAARLGVARRDARLATLRLLGVTSREVVALTLVETAWQGAVGAVLGIVLYGLLLPVVGLLPFQGTTFTVAELWVGWPGLLAAIVVVPLLAAVSGAISLRRVAISPLGVARRTTPRGMGFARLLVALVAIAMFMGVSAEADALGAFAVGAVVATLAIGFATLNLVGPWVLALVGKVSLRRATTPARLLTARRLLDDPRAAWRVVGGLGLACFVAGALTVVPVLWTVRGTQDRDDAMLTQDLMTGAMVTLVVAFLLAAVSAGIAQASAVLDRRREIALQNLAGMPVELLDSVRRRSVLVPLLFVAVGSAVTALVMLLPLLGILVFTDPSGVVVLVGALTVGCLLVFAATETSRPLLRSVLADTVVRAD